MPRIAADPGHRLRRAPSRGRRIAARIAAWRARWLRGTCTGFQMQPNAHGATSRRNAGPPSCTLPAIGDRRTRHSAAGRTALRPAASGPKEIRMSAHNPGADHRVCPEPLSPGHVLDRIWSNSRRLLGTMLVGIRREFERRSVERTLHRLDDRTLRDIGIHRSEISAVARRCAGEDPPPEPRRQPVGLHHWPRPPTRL